MTASTIASVAKTIPFEKPETGRRHPSIPKCTRDQDRLDAQNQVALSLRETDRDLQAVGFELGCMQNTLKAIIHNRHLAENDEWTTAAKNEIMASIMHLEHTGTAIRRRRKDLRAEAMLAFRGRDILLDIHVAASKSLFVGKHLNRHGDKDLTTTPSILGAY